MAMLSRHGLEASDNYKLSGSNHPPVELNLDRMWF